MEKQKEAGTKDSSLSTLHNTVSLYRLRVVCGFSTLSHFPVPPFLFLAFPSRISLSSFIGPGTFLTLLSLILPFFRLAFSPSAVKRDDIR